MIIVVVVYSGLKCFTTYLKSQHNGDELAGKWATARDFCTDRISEQRMFMKVCVYA